jgi:hypothetical protein
MLPNGNIHIYSPQKHAERTNYNEHKSRSCGSRRLASEDVEQRRELASAEDIQVACPCGYRYYCSKSLKSEYTCGDEKGAASFTQLHNLSRQLRGISGRVCVFFFAAHYVKASGAECWRLKVWGVPAGYGLMVSV